MVSFRRFNEAKMKEVNEGVRRNTVGHDRNRRDKNSPSLDLVKLAFWPMRKQLIRVPASSL